MAEPLTSWQIDFKEVTTVAPEADGKRLHAVESLNMIDTGTSILVDNPLRTDFNAETVIDSLAQTLQQVGCPRQITFDRDPRFVGSAGSTDFPGRFCALPDLSGYPGRDLSPTAPRQKWLRRTLQPHLRS